jgi:hypothetical protein
MEFGARSDDYSHVTTLWDFIPFVRLNALSRVNFQLDCNGGDGVLSGEDIDNYRLLVALANFRDSRRQSSRLILLDLWGNSIPR